MGFREDFVGAKGWARWFQPVMKVLTAVISSRTLPKLSRWMAWPWSTLAIQDLAAFTGAGYCRTPKPVKLREAPAIAATRTLLDSRETDNLCAAVGTFIEAQPCGIKKGDAFQNLEFKDGKKKKRFADLR